MNRDRRLFLKLLKKRKRRQRWIRNNNKIRIALIRVFKKTRYPITKISEKMLVEGFNELRERVPKRFTYLIVKKQTMELYIYRKARDIYIKEEYKKGLNSQEIATALGIEDWVVREVVENIERKDPKHGIIQKD